MRRITRELLVCVAALLSLFASAEGLDPSFYVEVPMEDGTKLSTDVYLPTEGPGPWPALLIRSTYGRIPAKHDSYVARGYAVVIQDVRGTGVSEGNKHVFWADTSRPGLMDGAWMVQWLKAQPWCNGKIATAGSSAMGMTSLLLAPTTHDVAAQLVQVAPSNFYMDSCYQGGVLRKNMMEGWLTAIGEPHIIPFYKSHPYFDDFWRYYDIASRAGDITAPAVFSAGWFDIFQQGTINGFISREEHGGPGAKGNNYLIIEPRTHARRVVHDYRVPKSRNSFLGGKLREAFIDYHLKGDLEALKPFAKVNYFTLGDDTDPRAPGNEWRTAEHWPPFDVKDSSYFLHEDGRLSTEPSEAAQASQGFTYDPKDPYLAWGGANLFFDVPSGPWDQRKYSVTRKDLLKFATAPLEKPLEITGRVTARLYVSTDAPDTDFTAKLVDVYPEGDDREILMVDSIRRVKLRETFEHPLPLLTSPDQIVQLDIDLQSISWVFNTGHRIGLHVSSSNYPRFEINANTGADHPEGEELRPAHNRVHMDKTHPSVLLLPVRPE